MLRIAVLCLLVALAGCTGYSLNESDFNFDFEKSESGMPLLWHYQMMPNYAVSVDSTQKRSGKYSLLVSTHELQGQYLCSFKLPGHYTGKNITLSGYIKTENVVDGCWAGLWMSIEPDIAFDDMMAHAPKQDTDWQKFEISLEMNPDYTEKIEVGVYLSGKGKAWFDDLQVSIDGKDIRGLKPYTGKREVKVFKALKDHGFDNGSHISDIPLDKKRIENLKYLGLIWGFLKYYHPAVGQGDYNWDYELLRKLPHILEAETDEQRDNVFMSWIREMGDFPAGKKRDTATGEDVLMPDLDWISESGFSEGLTESLLLVKEAKRTSQHYYVSYFSKNGNPLFRHENPYPEMKYPDAGFRMLALFRYWNMIQYYFPYRNLIGEDWKDVLSEFIPKFSQAADEEGYVMTVLELVTRINDGHAWLWGNPILTRFTGTHRAVPLLSFIEGLAVVTGFLETGEKDNTGLKVGDVITRINNRPVEEIMQEKEKYTSASNQAAKLAAIAINLLANNGEKLEIEAKRGSHTFRKRLDVYPPDVITNEIWLKSVALTDTCFKFVQPDIAYIYLGNIKKTYLPEIWEQVKNTKGLIIDIRCYPSDFVLELLGNCLMPETKVFEYASTTNNQTPGLFSISTYDTIGHPNTDYYRGQVVILVNERAQSSAESYAMAFRAVPRAIVVGSNTAGANGHIVSFNMPGELYTTLSSMGVYAADTSVVQRIGVSPDIQVVPTISGIRDGRDEVLERAIELVNSQMKTVIRF